MPAVSPLSAKLEIIDNFVVVSVVTVLCIRGFLVAIGFPQLGGDGLHIAHAIWGGLALTAALLIALLSSKPNKPILAVLGGIGFGFFIDEIGKFVTSNNNYFFAGSFFLMYLSLILFWFVSRLLVVRSEKRPFFVNASWPQNKIDRSLVLLWAFAQVVGAIPIIVFFLIRNNHHTFIDLITSAIIIAYATAILVSLIYVKNGLQEKGARMMQRSILFAIIVLLPTLYFEFATLASIGAVAAILVMIDLSEISMSKLLRIKRSKELI